MRSPTLRSLLLLAAIIALDAAAYHTLIRPRILTWGASAQEASVALPGDELAPFTSSTRAVTINAPRAKVWPWLVQLGADRGGFYSYTFLENLLGYDTGNAIAIRPEWQEMPVGRVIPSTAGAGEDPGKPSWKVLAVVPGRWFVLQGWGAFVLYDLPPGRSRLVVRTHGWETPGLLDKLGYWVLMPLHHIMERRMLLGIKARAEAGPGVKLTKLPDHLWLGGIGLSALGILLLILFGRGLGAAAMAGGLSLIWLWAALVPHPAPFYALTTLSLVAAALLWVWLTRRERE